MITLGSHDLGDGNVARHSADGTSQWEHALADGGVIPRAMAAGIDGRLAVVGGFKTSVEVNGQQVLTPQVGHTDAPDVFLLVLDAQGEPVDVWSTGGDRFDEGRDVAIDPTGTIWVAARSDSDLDLLDGAHVAQGRDALFERHCLP